MFSYGFEMDKWIKKNEVARCKEGNYQKSRIHESICVSYGIEMDRWIKTKWRGERKETFSNQEFMNACVSLWWRNGKVDKKRSGEVKGMKLQQ